MIYKFFSINAYPQLYWITLIYIATKLIEFFGQNQNFWSSFWIKIVDYFDNDEFFEVYATYIYMTLIYWILGIFFVIVDLINKPKFFQKYKVQPNTNSPLDKWKLVPVIGVVLFNQLILNLAVTKLVEMTQMVPAGSGLRHTQSFPELIISLILFEVLHEILFYYAHRLMHFKFLYKWIHKLHHSWTSPISFTAIYAHPIEHIVCNTLPVAIPIVILKIPVATSWIIIAIIMIWTLGDHSGYHVPFLHSSRFHDWHHLKFNENFGTNGILDKIHGTNKKFLESIESTRDRTLFTFQSANELYPDEINNKEK